MKLRQSGFHFILHPSAFRLPEAASRFSVSSLFRQRPRLSDLSDGDALALAARGGEHAPYGFARRLAAQTECGVVHRQDELRAHLARHLPSLFGVRVDVDVWVVRADWKDR